MSKKSASGIDLKTKAVKWYRYISSKINIYASENRESRKVIIEDITNSLDESTLRQVKEAIDNFSSSLFVGNMDKGFLAACYAHCIRDIDYRYGLNNYKFVIVNGNHLNSAEFKYDNCFGKNLSAKDVKKWMDWFSCGYTVFLHRLKIVDNYQCKEFFRSLVNSLVEIPTTKKNTIQSGLFIISIDSKSDLPDYFRDELKPIMLDGEECEVTQQKVENNVSLNRNKESTLFPFSGAKWSNVEMYLIDEDHFKIRANGVRRTVSYSEMGFKHKTATKKTALWDVLLKFAVENNSPVDFYDKKTKVEKDIQRLNGVLKQYFKIDTKPITYQSEKKGYVAGFKIYNKSYLREHMNSKTQAMSEEERLDEEIDKSINDSSV